MQRPLLTVVLFWHDLPWFYKLLYCASGWKKPNPFWLLDHSVSAYRPVALPNYWNPTWRSHTKKAPAPAALKLVWTQSVVEYHGQGLLGASARAPAAGQAARLRGDTFGTWSSWYPCLIHVSLTSQYLRILLICNGQSILACLCHPHDCNIPTLCPHQFHLFRVRMEFAHHIHTVCLGCSLLIEHNPKFL